MNWLFWIVCGGLLVAIAPVLIVSAICLVAMVADRVETKREERRQREKGVK